LGTIATRETYRLGVIILDHPFILAHPTDIFILFCFLHFFMTSYKLLSICLRPEVASLDDDLSKAVYILRNLMTKEDLSRQELYDYFKINRQRLQRRLWSELQSYTSNAVAKTRYLAEKHENTLMKTISEKYGQHKSASPGQVKTWVSSFFINNTQ